MHLSVLSDAFLSDSVDDSRWPFANQPEVGMAEDHKAGVVRGLIFIAIVALIVGLVTISGLIRSRLIETGFATYETSAPSIGPTR